MQQKVKLTILLILLIAAGCKKSNNKSIAVVTTTTATNISSTSGQVGGSITNNGGSAVTQSGICWALNSNPSLSDSVISAGTSSGSFSITIANLNPHTVYYYRAFAINGTGTGFGSIDSFTTANGVPTVTTAAITNNQALTAQTGGTVVKDGGAPVTARGVCWSTSANPTTSGSKTTHTGATGSFADTLANLTLNSTYYVRAYATNSFGTAYGNQVTFTVSPTGTITDIDGNVYGTITIGTQTWMTSNLRVAHYRNGNAITNGSTGFDWLNDTIGAPGVFVYPNGNPANDVTYGKLYNASAVNDTRGLAPAGWHVATDKDWYTLEFRFGLTAADTAANPNDDGLRGSLGSLLMVGGSSGLNLQLGGYVLEDASAPDFQSFGQFGLYWTSTPNTTNLSEIGNWLRGFNVAGPDQIYRTAFQSGSSVRCVKD